MHENLLRKHLAFVNRRNVVLLRDNTRPHSARNTQEKILYGLFVPSYFYLFPSPQNALKDKKCSQEDQVKIFVESFLSLKPV